MQKLRTAKVQPSLSLDTIGHDAGVVKTEVAKNHAVKDLSADRLDLRKTASRSSVRSVKAKPTAGSLGDGHPPVAVVGAGPTGLATAILLAQSGVPVEILEKRLDPEGSEGRRENQQAADLFQQAHQAAQRNQTTVADKLLAQAEAHHNKVALRPLADGAPGPAHHPRLREARPRRLVHPGAATPQGDPRG